jgi:predicted type IV restriction endonuclease
MPPIPSRVATRLTNGLKRFQPIIDASRARDDGEGDTVIIVTDVLAEVFGYDKYNELTAEFAIRGTYCDLAIKLDGAIQALVEVKAIGSELKDAHVKQSVDYAANQGVDWVVLTNGATWRVYRVLFAKPIEQELVVELDFCSLNPKTAADLEALYLFTKEGWVKSALGDFFTQKQALSRFFLGAMILSDPVLEVIRRELRRVSPDVRIDLEEIKNALASEVIKREVMEGDKADEARKKISRCAAKVLRARSARTEPEAASIPAPSAPATPPIVITSPLDQTVSPSHP